MLKVLKDEKMPNISGYQTSRQHFNFACGEYKYRKIDGMYAMSFDKCRRWRKAWQYIMYQEAG